MYDDKNMIACRGKRDGIMDKEIAVGYALLAARAQGLLMIICLYG